MRIIKLFKSSIKESILLFATFLFLFPLYYCFINAFKRPEDISLHPFTIWFNTFTIQNFIDFFIKYKYLRSLFYNISITVVALILIVFLCSMAAYALARIKGKLFKYYYFAIVIAIVLPFEIALIPLLVVLKALGLMYSTLGVSLIHVAWNAPFAIFLFTGYIRAVPLEIEESAIIDGCGMFRTYFSILLPLLKPIISACIILVGLWVWNDFLVAFMALNSANQLTMQVTLFYSYGKFLKQYNLLFAGIILASIPVLIMFLSMQKYFIKGITAGAIKG